jgi:hypothetical protein
LNRGIAGTGRTLALSHYWILLILCFLIAFTS